MSSLDFRTLMEEKFKHLKYDKILGMKLLNFKLEWGSKSDEYIDFLGTGLTGVHNVRFSLQDENILFNEILHIDQEDLQDKLYKTKGINRNFQVSSNATNITLFWLMHCFWKSNLDNKFKEEMMITLYSLFAYKQVGSFFSRRFPYGIDRNVAQTVFEKLSDKYLIKRLGNWEAVFRYQAIHLCPPKGSNANRIIKCSVDDVVKGVNDLQSRLRSTVQNLTAITYDYIKEKDRPTLTTTNMINSATEESAEGLKDLTTSTSQYVNYLKSILHSPNDFVIEDLVHIVNVVMPACKKDKLKDMLMEISINHFHLDPKKDFVMIAIKSSLEYLQTKSITHGYLSKTMECLNILKKYYSASKVKEKEVPIAKKELEKIAIVSLKTKTPWLITPYIIGTFLYLFLRSLVKS